MVRLIERQLKLTLPPACADYISNFPFAPNSYVVWASFVYLPQQIVQINERYRTNGFAGHSWPENYLIIGGDGQGNEYFLDVTEEHSPVLLADRDISAGAAQLVLDLSDDLPAWVKTMQHMELTTPNWLKAQALGGT